MKKFKKLRKLLNNNSGFSLIEMLVAIIMLGIVVVPLLQAFVVSLQINAKTERMDEATVIAQSIAEEIDSKSINEIVTSNFASGAYGSLFGENFNFMDVDDKDQPVALEYNNVDDYYSDDIFFMTTGADDHFPLSFDRYNYRAEVTIDAKVADDTDTDNGALNFEYNVINNENLSDFNNIDIIFRQESGSLANPDVVALNDFAYTELVGVQGFDITEDLDKVTVDTRDIVVDVWRGNHRNNVFNNVGEDSSKMYATVTYTYSFRYVDGSTYIYGKEDYKQTIDMLPMGHPIGTVQDDGAVLLDMEIPGIYVFYYPMYKEPIVGSVLNNQNKPYLTQTLGMDNVRIVNSSNLDVEFFMYRMADPQYFTSDSGVSEYEYNFITEEHNKEFSNLELNYQYTTLSLYEGYTVNSEPDATVNSNLITNLHTEIINLGDSNPTMEVPIAGTTNQKLRYFLNDSSIVYNDKELTNDTGGDAKNRIYDIEIVLTEENGEEFVLDFTTVQ